MSTTTQTPTASFFPGITIDLRMHPDLVRQTLALIAYTVLAVVFMEIVRPQFGIAVAVIASVLTDMLLTLILERTIRVPLGPIITGLSLYLLIFSHDLLPYAYASIASQVGKKVFRADGRQIFNPSNFGMLTMICTMPKLGVFVPGQWSSAAVYILIMMAIGTTVCIYARKMTTVLTYLGAVVAVGTMRCFLTHTPFLLYAGSAIGVPQTLFAFHMITDPKASPSSRPLQVLFGGLVGLLDGTLRWLVIFNAPFMSLLIICGLWPLFRPALRRWE